MPVVVGFVAVVWALLAYLLGYGAATGAVIGALGTVVALTLCRGAARHRPTPRAVFVEPAATPATWADTFDSVDERYRAGAERDLSDPAWLLREGCPHAARLVAFIDAARTEAAGTDRAGCPWETHELAVLRRDDLTVPQMAALLRRPVEQVRRRRHQEAATPIRSALQVPDPTVPTMTRHQCIERETALARELTDLTQGIPLTDAAAAADDDRARVLHDELGRVRRRLEHLDRREAQQARRAQLATPAACVARMHEIRAEMEQLITDDTRHQYFTELQAEFTLVQRRWRDLTAEAAPVCGPECDAEHAVSLDGRRRCLHAPAARTRVACGPQCTPIYDPDSGALLGRVHNGPGQWTTACPRDTERTRVACPLVCGEVFTFATADGDTLYTPPASHIVLPSQAVHCPGRGTVRVDQQARTVTPAALASSDRVMILGPGVEVTYLEPPTIGYANAAAAAARFVDQYALPELLSRDPDPGDHLHAYRQLRRAGVPKTDAARRALHDPHHPGPDHG